MALRALKYGRGFWRTAPNAPPDIAVPLRLTLKALEAAETLPGTDDVFDVIPPSLHVYRRRIGASGWWVYYELREDAVVVSAVRVPK